MDVRDVFHKLIDAARFTSEADAQAAKDAVDAHLGVGTSVGAPASAEAVQTDAGAFTHTDPTVGPDVRDPGDPDGVHPDGPTVGNGY